VPVDAAAAASLAVATLSKVMAIPHPGFLVYQSFDVDRGGSLVWSELGLKVAEPAQSAAETADQLLRTLREETGIESLDFDDDGDAPLRYGSVLLFARVSGNTPSVRLHARILGEVRSSAALLKRLNDLNERVVRPAFFHASESIYAVADIPASPFEGDMVRPARLYEPPMGSTSCCGRIRQAHDVCQAIRAQSCTSASPEPQTGPARLADTSSASQTRTASEQFERNQKSHDLAESRGSLGRLTEGSPRRPARSWGIGEYCTMRRSASSSAGPRRHG
jgi:hypothetical protein